MTVPMQIRYASRDFDAFLEDARTTLGLSTGHQTYTVVEAVLVAFRRRLTAKQAMLFAQILPPVLRAIFVQTWDPTIPPTSPSQRPDWTRDAKSFRGEHNFAPDRAVRDVACALRRAIDPRDFARALSQMPSFAEDYWSVEAD